MGHFECRVSLFLSDAPDATCHCLTASQSKLITSTVTFYPHRCRRFISVCPPTQSMYQHRQVNKEPSEALSVFFASPRPRCARPATNFCTITNLPYMGCTLPVEESGPCPVPPLLSFPAPESGTKTNSSKAKKFVFRDHIKSLYCDSCSPACVCVMLTLD